MNNSYRIEFRGLRADAIAAVKGASAVPPGSPQAQIEADKTALLAKIAALPEKFTGISVYAQGDAFPTQLISSHNVVGYVIEPSPETKAVAKPSTH